MYRLLVLLLMLCSMPAWAAPAVVVNAHKSTHKIEMGGGSCSATAVGPHALLTATHCTAPTVSMSVDGTDVVIVSITSDSLDHSLLLIDGIEFTNYADIVQDAKVEQADEVFVFGNPGEFTDMFRKGYVAGYYQESEDAVPPLLQMLTNTKPEKHEGLTLYDFNGFFGDSGSGVFDEQGNVVAVVSVIIQNADRGYAMKYMGSYKLRFTQDALKQARSYAPPKSKNKEGKKISLEDLLLGNDDE